MRTERSGRSIAIGTAALASSIVLVCRPRPTMRRSRRDASSSARFAPNCPTALRTLQHGNIAPVDLAQAAIGPGMAVFSRYAKVVEADGSAMTVRTALGLINQALDEILAEQEGDFDADTRLAVTWFEQHGFDEGAYGEADVLARAKNTRSTGMARGRRPRAAGGQGAAAAPRRASRRLGSRARRPHRRRGRRRSISFAGSSGGEAAAADSAAPARRRFGETRRARLPPLHDLRAQGLGEEALAYNALVVAWPEIARQVAGTPEAEGAAGARALDAMAVTNNERVQRALAAPCQGLAPFVDARLTRRTRRGLAGRGRRTPAPAANSKDGHALPADGDDPHVARRSSSERSGTPSATRSPSCSTRATAGRTRRRSLTDDAYRALDTRRAPACHQRRRAAPRSDTLHTTSCAALRRGGAPCARRRVAGAARGHAGGRTSGRGARSSRRTPTSRPGATSRRSSPPTSTRSGATRPTTSTASPTSSSGARS